MTHDNLWLSAFIALAVLAAGSASAAERLYRIDPVHSQVLFSVSHNGYSNPVGRLPLTRGWIRLEGNDLGGSAAEAEIDLAAVDMGDAGWDEAVRGSRLLDADKQRYAHFVSSSVESLNDHQGRLHGTLSLNGHKVPVIVAFTLNREGTTIFGLEKRIGFSGRARLDRRQFGITAHPGSIGRWVEVRVEIEGVADADAVDEYRKGVPDDEEDNDDT